jgi:hypothetical protein
MAERLHNTLIESNEQADHTIQLIGTAKYNKTKKPIS